MTTVAGDGTTSVVALDGTVTTTTLDGTTTDNALDGTVTTTAPDQTTTTTTPDRTTTTTTTTDGTTTTTSPEGTTITEAPESTPVPPKDDFLNPDGDGTGTPVSVNAFPTGAGLDGLVASVSVGKAHTYFVTALPQLAIGGGLATQGILVGFKQ